MTDSERIEALEKENHLLKDTIKTLQDAVLSLSRQTHVHYCPPPIILPVAPLQPAPVYPPLPPPTYQPPLRPFQPMCFGSGSLQGVN